MTTHSVPSSNKSAPFCLTAELQSKSFRALQALTVWLLTAFVFVLPTDLRIGGDKSLAMRIGYLCVVVGLMGIYRRHTLHAPPLSFWLLFGFVVWSTCALVWARYPFIAQHKVVEYWRLFIILTITVQYAWETSVRQRLMDAYIAGCWLGITGLFFHFAIGTPYLAEGELEFQGRYTFGTDPNYLALALVIALPLALHRALQMQVQWKRVLMLSYVPAGFVGLLLTGSRGAWIALLAIILVSGVMLRGRFRGMLVATVLLLIVVPFFLPGSVMERISSIPNELIYGTLSDRTELWQRGIGVVVDQPLTGIGAGATAGIMSIAAHNTPLELLMESGAIGLLLFYGAWVFSIRDTWKAERREGIAATLIAAGWFVGSASLSWEAEAGTWLFLGLFIAAGSARRLSTERHRVPRTMSPAYLSQ